MARPVLVAILGVLYLLAAAWLVHREGVSYRHGLLRVKREAGLAARDVPSTTSQPGPEVDPTGQDTPPAADIAKPAPAVVPSEKTGGQPPPPPPADPGPTTKEPLKAAEAIPPAVLPGKVEDAVPKPSGMRLDEVRRARRALTDVDKDPLALTLDEERRVGRAVHDLILQQHRKMVPGALQRRVQDAALPLLGLRQRKDLDYHFILLDSDNVNAFSHPGGYVYINRGVFDLIADDAELQFVLAHEMAHVDLKHAAKEVARSLRGAPIGGPDDPGLVQRFYHQVAQGYTEDEEIEADARAYRQLIELGRTPRESLSFARRFLGYVERNGLEAGGHKPATDLDAEVQDVENHWPSHPSAMDRVDRLQLLRGKPQHQ